MRKPARICQNCRREYVTYRCSTCKRTHDAGHSQSCKEYGIRERCARPKGRNATKLTALTKTVAVRQLLAASGMGALSSR